MKVKLILASVALMATSYGADVNRLVEALVRVESNGKANAVGDRGKAVGVLQIHDIMVQEANRLAQTRYSHKDMFNPAAARDVAKIVLNHYSKTIQKTTGREATEQELAYIWNGGASSWKRVAAPQNDTKPMLLCKGYVEQVRRS